MRTPASSLSRCASQHWPAWPQARSQTAEFSESATIESRWPEARITAAGGQSSTTAMAGSTETEQFHDKAEAVQAPGHNWGSEAAE